MISSTEMKRKTKLLTLMVQSAEPLYSRPLQKTKIFIKTHLLQNCNKIDSRIERNFLHEKHHLW